MEPCGYLQAKNELCSNLPLTAKQRIFLGKHVVRVCLCVCVRVCVGGGGGEGGCVYRITANKAASGSALVGLVSAVSTQV